MFKYICLFGILIACGSAFPSQPQPQEAQTTTILLPSTVATEDTKGSGPTNPAEHIKTNNQPATIIARPQNAASSLPIRVAETFPTNHRSIIVLHKPHVVTKPVDDQESLDNAASEWWSNQWENYWWRTENQQFDNYSPYDSVNIRWGQPQYYSTSWY